MDIEIKRDGMYKSLDTVVLKTNSDLPAFNYTQEQTDEAKDYLTRLLCNEKFGKPGARNDSMVDAAIWCGILDIDVVDMLDELYRNAWIDSIDLAECKRKYDIIRPYESDWLGSTYQHAVSKTLDTLTYR